MVPSRPWRRPKATSSSSPLRSTRCWVHIASCISRPKARGRPGLSKAAGCNRLPTRPAPDRPASDAKNATTHFPGSSDFRRSHSVSLERVLSRPRPRWPTATPTRNRNMRKLRITVDGRSYNVVVEDLGEGAEAAEPAPAAAPPAPSAGSVVAPLGGVVDSIHVTLGSVIAVGDKVATIEAMKMKNDVRSHVAGKVTNIAVIVNQGVETGQVLMTVA